MFILFEAEQEMLYLQQPEMPENPKILKISVLGVPNSGKSTLVNRLMNRRVSLIIQVQVLDLYYLSLMNQTVLNAPTGMRGFKQDKHYQEPDHSCAHRPRHSSGKWHAILNCHGHGCCSINRFTRVHVCDVM